jgi:cell division septation protein DedD
LIAAAYLGSRILTAHSPRESPVKIGPVASVPAAPVPAAPVPAAKANRSSQPNSEAPSPPPEEPAAADPPKIAGEQIAMIDPQAGERYIQVSALTEEAARRYIQQLRQAKLEPHLAPGPRPELLRVLIGPFADQDALAQTKTDLARAGIKNFVRKY